MTTVAFPGLGVMGYPMAHQLRAKGHEVTVYNRTAAKAGKWVAANGGRAEATPAAAALERTSPIVNPARAPAGWRGNA